MHDKGNTCQYILKVNSKVTVFMTRKTKVNWMVSWDVLGEGCHLSLAVDCSPTLSLGPIRLCRAKSAFLLAPFCRVSRRLAGGMIKNDFLVGKR